MTTLHSHLGFTFNKIENTSESAVPKVIYKYFDTIKDRQNFLDGWIWFSGPNQNRFFVSHPDPLEYRNNFSSFLYEYSLSCSRMVLDEDKPSIKIIEPQLFVKELINSIQNNKENFCNQVAWLSYNELLEKAYNLPVIKWIKKFPDKNKENIILHVNSVGIRHLKYVDKITDFNLKSSYESLEIAKNARDHNNDYEYEEEVRIHINSGDFLGVYNGNCLMNLVQYLKIYCPEIKKYCFVT